MCGDGDSEWRIHGPAPEEVVVVRGGSNPAVIVGGQVEQVIPEPYGQLLALQHPGTHLHGVEETAPRDVATSGSEIEPAPASSGWSLHDVEAGASWSMGSAQS
jgi:hypothetical protein